MQKPKISKSMEEFINEYAKDDSFKCIMPETGWMPVNFKELFAYRDLFYFMVWREIKALYAQTILGFSWAVLQPLVQIVIFTVIFGQVAKIHSDGIPYFLFSTVAIIPWTYISTAMAQSSQSLIGGQYMLGKVYFPRLIFPIAPLLSKLVDFGISMIILFVVLIYYRPVPTLNLLLLPVFIIYMILVPAGIGMWLSALGIRYRDVRHAMPFVIRLLMFSAPIVYSATTIPDHYRFVYSLNPIVGVIEGFRACLIGTPMPWLYVLPSMITAMVILISGAFYFKRMEHLFVDVI